MTQPTPIRRVAGSRPRLLDAFCCQGGAANWVGDHALTHLITPGDVAA